MGKARVQLWNHPAKSVVVDPDATAGAIIGVNLYWPDGSLATEADLLPEPAPSPIEANQTAQTFQDVQDLKTEIAKKLDHQQTMARVSLGW